MVVFKEVYPQKTKKAFRELLSKHDKGAKHDKGGRQSLLEISWEKKSCTLRGNLYSLWFQLPCVGAVTLMMP
jgi:hypothetical protein